MSQPKQPRNSLKPAGFTLLAALLGGFVAVAADNFIWETVSENQESWAKAVVYVLTVFSGAAVGAYALLDGVAGNLRQPVQVAVEGIISRTVAALQKGSRGESTTVEEIAEIAHVAARWYTRVQARRWIFSAVLALGAGFAGLSGSAFLLQQNALLERQSQLIESQDKFLRDHEKRQMQSEKARYAAHFATQRWDNLQEDRHRILSTFPELIGTSPNTCEEVIDLGKLGIGASNLDWRQHIDDDALPILFSCESIANYGESLVDLMEEEVFDEKVSKIHIQSVCRWWLRCSPLEDIISRGERAWPDLAKQCMNMAKLPVETCAKNYP